MTTATLHGVGTKADMVRIGIAPARTMVKVAHLVTAAMSVIAIVIPTTEVTMATSRITTGITPTMDLPRTTDLPATVPAEENAET